MLTPLVLPNSLFCGLLSECVCRCLSGNMGRPFCISMHPLFSGAAAKAKPCKGKAGGMRATGPTREARVAAQYGAPELCL